MTTRYLGKQRYVHTTYTRSNRLEKLDIIKEKLHRVVVKINSLESKHVRPSLSAIVGIYRLLPL